LIRVEARLQPEGASGATLAGTAVTDRDRERIARNLETELAAMTGGFSGRHANETSERSAAAAYRVRNTRGFA
jgi:hypothetical protein